MQRVLPLPPPLRAREERQRVVVWSRAVVRSRTVACSWLLMVHLPLQNNMLLLSGCEPGQAVFRFRTTLLPCNLLYWITGFTIAPLWPKILSSVTEVAFEK